MNYGYNRTNNIMFNTIKKYSIAYRNKITNKLFGVVYVAHQGKKAGAVLLSYLTGPFTLAPGEFFTDPHPNYWVAPEIARLFSERGYDVDVINWDNNNFVPNKKYVACIDLNSNLERLAPLLSPDCKKVVFITGSNPSFQNAAEEKRLELLQKRSGVLLYASRAVPQTTSLAYADFAIGYGNITSFKTFSSFRKKILPIPIPAMDTYEFQEHKNFEEARKHFLWFGGGGAILKGLDLVVEAFAGMPHLKLSIMGPAAYEKEFRELYAHELGLPNITVYERPRIDKNGTITSSGKNVIDIFNSCAAIIYPSASEGGGGAVVHAMQAGLFPIITPQTSIDERAPSIVIENPTIENIRSIVINFSKLPPEEIKKLSKEVWGFAREHHTKEAFTKAYGDFIDNTLELNK